MVKVSFPWVNEGDPFTLAEIPLKGKRELLELQKSRSEYLSIVTQYRFFYLCRAALATKKLIKAKGIEKAKDAWDATIDQQFQGNKEFKWELGDFSENLESWITDFVLVRLDAEDEEAAEVKMKELEKALVEKAEGLGDDFAEKQLDYYLIELYWRLRASGMKEINTPSGVTSIPWSLDKRDEAMNLLEEVVTEEDLMLMYAGKKGDEDSFSVEEFAPQEVADVEGK